MVVGGIGGTGGYMLGAIDWLQTNIGTLMGSNEATVFAIVVIVLAVGLVITLTSFREVSLPQLEKDELLRPITKANFEAEKRKQLTMVFNISDVVADPVKPHNTEYIPVDEDEPPLTFANFIKGLWHMPRSLMIIYLTQWLSQLGYLSYCLYFTDFVGSAVFGGDVAVRLSCSYEVSLQ